ncbi:MAG: hemerythrin domain-containing protein [Ferruginibacter sp.]
MKTDVALAPLSREHHNTLILAQLLKKFAPVYKHLPTTAIDKATYAVVHFEAHLRKRFHKEEFMLNKVKDCHASVADLESEIKQEHLQLTKLFLSLCDTNDLAHTMDELAVCLQHHIRKEERVLFPLLQQYCSQAQLKEIYELLH